MFNPLLCFYGNSYPRISPKPERHIRAFYEIHNSASAFLRLYEFDHLRIRACTENRISSSALLRFVQKA